MYHNINNIIILCRYKHIYLTVIICEQFFQKYKTHYNTVVRYSSFAVLLFDILLCVYNDNYIITLKCNIIIIFRTGY